MKKLSVIVLALVLVVSLASVSFAATESFAGEVSVTLTNGVITPGSENAKVSFDFTKTYNDNLSAGLTFYEKLDTVTDGKITLTHGFDPAGFIKFNYAPLVVTLKTSASGNVAKDLAAGADLTGAAGVLVDYTVMEGATVSAVVNAPAKMDCNYLVKGVYSANGLTLGGGYQVDGANDAMAAYGSLALGSITVGGEYVNRMKANATGILANASATLGALSVNGKFLNKSKGFASGDADAMSAFTTLKTTAAMEGNAIATSATFKVSDALSANGAFEMILGGIMSYNAGATYALSSALSAAASYKACDTNSAVNVTLTDTFAAGLVGSLSMDMDLDASTQAYTAKVVATL